MYNIFSLFLPIPRHCILTNNSEDFYYISKALDLIRGKNTVMLLDSSLEGQYTNEDATKLIDLSSKCLQFEPRDRPNSKFLLNFLGPLQKQNEVT